jgi:hypothetical protein
MLAFIFVMLVWPWIFLAVIWSRKGVQASNHLAKGVRDHPHRTSFFVTFIANMVNLIVSILFSFTIIRYAQEMVASGKPVNAFEVSLLSGFRHQNWPFSMKDLNQNRSFFRTKWIPIVGIAVCIVAFAFVPSGTTSLITPVPFNRTAPLTGTELDFSSSAADCLDWFHRHSIPNNCDWQVS